MTLNVKKYWQKHNAKCKDILARIQHDKIVVKCNFLNRKREWPLYFDSTTFITI